MKIKSIILVIVQVAGIVLICVTAKPVCTRIALLAFQAAGLALLIWTMLYLQPGKFHILPDPVKSNRLVTKGPFRFIRHPMYLSLFLYLLPLIIEYFSFIRLGIFLIFVANMIIKLFYEERLMMAEYEQYAEYMKRTRRLIPYIF
jgi:protein-S-isoprenylcysteine O-methyltransferase Ste14